MNEQAKPRCDRCEFWAVTVGGYGECGFGYEEQRVRFVIRKAEKLICGTPNMFAPLKGDEAKWFSACVETPADWYCSDFQVKTNHRSVDI